ncbi:ABC transporter permease [Desulfuribacillus alkaliarsenatis]|uniref:ABC transmembrane type-2 domain-containing protein n=1 Tax=Desulfuribacillus alkaliarsenatis TaxID=766136 RepID=A0A1E5G378_9FIRM|nr:ABC transporter permease [Desulfuribacillus alkaliarsenatis]OEF97527.1 hypothetical protein BHF68_04795 [Desulfuribacillus alkaliarsenatis]
MAWFWMLHKEFYAFVKDKTSLFSLLLVPLILIGILGISLSNAFDTGDGEAREVKVAPMSVYVENLDRGPMGDYLQKVAFTSEEVQKLLKLTNARDQAEVFVIIPEDFTEKGWSLAGDVIEIRIATDNPNRIGVKVVESVVEMFLRQTKMLYLMYEQQHIGVPDGAKGNSSAGAFAGPEALFGGDRGQGAIDLPVIQELSVGSSNGNIVSSFAYYAVGMGVMYVLFLGVTAAKALMIEVQQKTMLRLLATPQSILGVLLGKFSGWVLLGVLQIMILIAGSKLLYGVDWGNNFVQLVLLSISYVFVVIALGFILATLLAKSEAADQFGTIAVLIMAVIGGSMAPIYILPEFINQIAKVLPNALALQTILEIIIGTDWAVVLKTVAVFMIMGTTFVLLGTYRLTQQWKG